MCLLDSGEIMFKTINNKHFIYFLLTLLLFINLTTIYASDNNTIIDNNQILTSDSNDNLSSSITLKDGSFEDIQKAIDNAKNGDVITLNGKFTATDNSSIISINKKLTLTSSNAVLDGNNLSGIFYLRQKSSGSTINGLTFVNGYRTIGSAMFINAVNVTVNNCRFENNTAYAYGGGGAVCTSYDLEKSANLIVSNSKFISNRAPVSSGALAAYGYNSKIINCYFENNIALKYLNYTTYEAALQIGINNLESKGYVSNSTFKNNKAEYSDNTSSQGGATAIRKGVFIENSIFINNNAKYGGAISVYETGTVSNCIFLENNAYEGGAISVNNSNKDLKIFII